MHANMPVNTQPDWNGPRCCAHAPEFNLFIHGKTINCDWKSVQQDYAVWPLTTSQVNQSQGLYSDLSYTYVYNDLLQRMLE